MARPVFFTPSRGTLDELTQLFDFVWPTAAAMWNLRWQVRGFLDATPHATQDDLVARFVRGSGVNGAGNLRGACVEKTWEEQQRVFAKFLLIDLCAIFESWITQVLACLASASATNEKDLQFPTNMAGTTPRGVLAAVARLTNPESAVLRSSFYDLLKASPKNALPRLDNLLHCYRFFKECRNCLAHNGGIATAKAVESYLQFSTVAHPASLGVTEVPAHNKTILGDPIRLDLRGVVGFSDIVLRIVVTLDAELSRSVRAERHFKEQWLRCNGRRYTLKTASADERARQVQRLVAKLRLPRPLHTAALETWLRTEQLVS
jgi:hypothetical protein